MRKKANESSAREETSFDMLMPLCGAVVARYVRAKQFYCAYKTENASQTKGGSAARRRRARAQNKCLEKVPGGEYCMRCAAMREWRVMRDAVRCASARRARCADARSAQCARSDMFAKRSALAPAPRSALRDAVMTAMPDAFERRMSPAGDIWFDVC